VTSRSSTYPDLSTLTEGLASIFRPVGDGRRLAVIDRAPNGWGGTFPAEIVTCRLDGLNEFRVFCKYETGASAGSYGHRGGVAYERQVYRDLLQPLSLTVPRYYGSYEDERQGWLWFAVEYLDDSLPVSKAREPDAVVRAASWIARFHAVLEDRIQSDAPLPLLRYDREYYRGWAERTQRLCAALVPDGDWVVPVVCRRLLDEVDLLLQEPLTVVHGEYYPKNIRCQAGTIRPIDWESAAIGAGEVDVASLTERWPDEVVRDCQRIYAQTRWRLATPADFERRLDLARLYLHFRWLGSPKGWRVEEEAAWRIQEIRDIAERQCLL
jgi:hypothetical protein